MASWEIFLSTHTAHQLSDVAVLLHHGGDGNGSLRTQSIVTQVQVSHIGVGLHGHVMYITTHTHTHHILVQVLIVDFMQTIYLQTLEL